jgi:hypothetical protein
VGSLPGLLIQRETSSNYTNRLRANEQARYSWRELRLALRTMVDRAALHLGASRARRRDRGSHWPHGRQETPRAALGATVSPAG